MVLLFRHFSTAVHHKSVMKPDAMVRNGDLNHRCLLFLNCLVDLPFRNSWDYSSSNSDRFWLVSCKACSQIMPLQHQQDLCLLPSIPPSSLLWLLGGIRRIRLIGHRGGTVTNIWSRAKTKPFPPIALQGSVGRTLRTILSGWQEALWKSTETRWMFSLFSLFIIRKVRRCFQSLDTLGIANGIRALTTVDRV